MSRFNGVMEQLTAGKSPMRRISHLNRQLTFRGAAYVAPLADKQQGPTCGFEALENLIQLFHPVGNNLTEADLIPRASHYGAVRWTPAGPQLMPHAYQRILQDYHIPSHWYPFDHERIMLPALWNDRGVLVIGDAHYLNATLYPHQGSCHAFVVTNYYTEESGAYQLGYIGIDSNVPHTEVVWPDSSVEYAAYWTAHYVTKTPVLITDSSIQWPSKMPYYMQTPTGQIVPFSGKHLYGG